MQTQNATGRLSITRRILRYFLPDSWDTVCGVGIVVCGAAFTLTFLDLSSSNVQCPLLGESPLFSTLVCVGPVSCALWLILTLIVAWRTRWAIFSILVRCSLLAVIAVTWMLSIAYLNYKLDRATPTLVDLVVAETFVVEFGANGYYLDPGEESFVAFDTPPGLENWKIINLSWARLKQQPTLDSFTIGQSFQAHAYAGYFGCPWFAFPPTKQMRRLSGATPPPGTTLADIRIGRSSMKREHERNNIMWAHGCFQPDSPNRKQLVDWGVPVNIDDHCPE